MALSKKQAGKVARESWSRNSEEGSLELIAKMNEAAYGKKSKRSLRSFKRIMTAISAMN